MGKGGKSKGGGQWVFVPSVKQNQGKGKAKGKGKGKGNGKKRTDGHPDEDPPNSCRVYVIGFDIGTTDEQFEGHMKQAGPIHAVHWVSKCKAVVVYKKKSSLSKAQDLNETVIDGNERYITVITSDK
eukprot:TRINITY_DN385_c0_g1_i1.p1 TRINITY_DN385_c0_g1~~TRINITY_DN385_c0_g1_i1.p1  ORF type:complete len:127 (-),score=29.73 TRINITY_DN385_c0_g1_i1:208-588(-)